MITNINDLVKRKKQSFILRLNRLFETLKVLHSAQLIVKAWSWYSNAYKVVLTPTRKFFKYKI